MMWWNNSPPVTLHTCQGFTFRITYLYLRKETYTVVHFDDKKDDALTRGVMGTIDHTDSLDISILKLNSIFCINISFIIVLNKIQQLDIQCPNIYYLSGT